MGSTSTSAFDFAAYRTVSATTYAKAATAQDAFKARSLDPYLDPKTFMVRESRNSDGNPKSTPCIFALDVTGSMGSIALEIAKEGLGILLKEVIDRKPVSDPHLMFMGIGDVLCDTAPLQASQFETDMKIVDQLGKLWVEGCGGGNSFESYNLPWHFAAYHTSADAFEKDNRKGFIFTFGDERCPPDLTAEDLIRVYGNRQEPVATNKELLENLANKYHVFHMIIEEGQAMRYDGKNVKDSWQSVLGQRAIPVSDYKKLPEIIVSTMQIVAGEDTASVIKSWASDTAVVVSNAVRNLTGLVANSTSGLVRL